ncbi:hypothetical protein [Polaromonas eurypsychrophila]|uniref:hypothetical protein n=1 Tax=Polaromonas eurypsychrophila TaxID=1614635 RepID=UPI001E3FB452|nr:hypothetical protein [Polaromonas eurypsychrophila]
MTRATNEPSSLPAPGKVQRGEDGWIDFPPKVLGRFSQRQVSIPKRQGVADQHQINIAAGRVLLFGDGALDKCRMDARSQWRKCQTQGFCQTHRLARYAAQLMKDG